MMKLVCLVRGHRWLWSLNSHCVNVRCSWCGLSVWSPAEWCQADHYFVVHPGKSRLETQL